MAVFMAGATIFLHLAARTTVVSISSAMPWASLAMMLAVAGAITSRSAFFASATCSTSQLFGRSKVSVTQGLLLRVSKVRGATNRQALRVMITCTAAPALRSRETASQLL